MSTHFQIEVSFNLGKYNGGCWQAKSHLTEMESIYKEDLCDVLVTDKNHAKDLK